MKSVFLTCGFFFFLACSVKKDIHQSVEQKDVERIIRTLSADDMAGRGLFTPGIEKAAGFIETEFRAIGLQPLAGQSSFRQDFSMLAIKPVLIKASINGEPVEGDRVIVITDRESLNWTKAGGTDIHYIKSGSSFTEQYGKIMRLGKPAMVFVDEEFLDSFNQMHHYFMGDRVVEKTMNRPEMVFILSGEIPKAYQISFRNKIEKSPLFNIAGIIPGKNKPDEFVIFSAHYDHLGVIVATEGDSIANGADDDASGVTAVISLAKHFKRLNTNGRTLIFVAFTGEESGQMGSGYFATKIASAKVSAMFNIEMIGKESKFGKNAAFITGFERSNLGSILQKNLDGTGFTLHPDPYPEQNLFYRSDNASLALLGVPAHTISTDQIDKDKFYHTVNDEIETLSLDNITATIKAIALSARTIVAGTDTPTRVALQGNK